MRNGLEWVYLNGKTVRREDARVSVFDSGFLYGEGVFTTLKVRATVPLFLDRHLTRLKDNARQVGIDFKVNIEKAVKNVIRKNRLEKGGIRITITGGESWEAGKTPSCFIQAFTYDDEPQAVSIITTPETRDIYKTIKTTNRLPNFLAQKKAKERQAQDAVFCVEDKLVEATYANLYSKRKDKTIITPPIAKRGLNGISRQILIKNLPIMEEEISVKTNGPMVLLSSLGMRVVKKIDGREIRQDEVFVDLIKKTMEAAEKDYIDRLNNE